MLLVPNHQIIVPNTIDISTSVEVINYNANDIIYIELYGDSIMCGLDPDLVDDDCGCTDRNIQARVPQPPARLLEIFLPQHKLIITNRSSGLSASGDLLFGTDGVNLAWPDQQEANIVVINHGINDARYDVPVQQYESNLRQLRDGLSSDKVMVWQTPTATRNFDTSDYAEAMKRVASDYDDIVADAHAITRWLGELPDGIHPRQLGYVELVDLCLSSAVNRAIIKFRGIPKGQAHKFLRFDNQEKYVLENSNTVQLNFKPPSHSWLEVYFRDNVSFRAVSRGYNDVKGILTSGVYNGDTNEKLVSTGRSYNLTKIKRDQGRVVFNKNYDVYGNSAEALKLANELNETTDDYIVVITTHDEPKTNRLEDRLKSALARCGASAEIFESPNFKFRSSYVLVGIPGCGPGNGYEAYNGAVDGYPATMYEDIKIKNPYWDSAPVYAPERLYYRSAATNSNWSSLLNQFGVWEKSLTADFVDSPVTLVSNIAGDTNSGTIKSDGLLNVSGVKPIARWMASNDGTVQDLRPPRATTISSVNLVIAEAPNCGPLGMQFGIQGISYVTIHDAPKLQLTANVTNPFTIEAIIWPLQGGGGGMIINKDPEYEIALDSNGNVIVALDWGVGSDVNLPGGGWYYTNVNVPWNKKSHLAWVVSGTDFYIYVDGVLEHTENNLDRVNVNVGNPVTIGNRPGQNQQFYGYIIDVRIWDQALSAASLAFTKDFLEITEVPFQVGVAPLLQHYVPTNGTSPTHDLVIIGNAVTVNELKTYGIYSLIQDLLIGRPGLEVNWNTSYTAERNFKLGYWHWDIRKSPAMAAYSTPAPVNTTLSPLMSFSIPSYLYDPASLVYQLPAVNTGWSISSRYQGSSSANPLLLTGISALGDSTTWGYSLGVQVPITMVKSAEDTLRNTFGINTTAVNLGTSGTTVRDLLGFSIPPAPNTSLDLTAAKASTRQIVVVNYGINEAYRSSNPDYSVNQFTLDLTNLVNQLKFAGKTVVLQTPNQVDLPNIPAQADFYNVVRNWAQDIVYYAQAVRLVAQNTGVILHDKWNSTVWNIPGAWPANDPVHPTQASYITLGVELATVIKNATPSGVNTIYQVTGQDKFASRINTANLPFRTVPPQPSVAQPVPAVTGPVNLVSYNTNQTNLPFGEYLTLSWEQSINGFSTNSTGVAQLNAYAIFRNSTGQQVGMIFNSYDNRSSVAYYTPALFTIDQVTYGSTPVANTKYCNSRNAQITGSLQTQSVPYTVQVKKQQFTTLLNDIQNSGIVLSSLNYADYQVVEAGMMHLIYTGNNPAISVDSDVSFSSLTVVSTVISQTGNTVVSVVPPTMLYEKVNSSRQPDSASGTFIIPPDFSSKSIIIIGAGDWDPAPPTGMQDVSVEINAVGRQPSWSGNYYQWQVFFPLKGTYTFNLAADNRAYAEIRPAGTNIPFDRAVDAPGDCGGYSLVYDNEYSIPYCGWFDLRIYLENIGDEIVRPIYYAVPSNSFYYWSPLLLTFGVYDLSGTLNWQVYLEPGMYSAEISADEAALMKFSGPEYGNPINLVSTSYYVGDTRNASDVFENGLSVSVSGWHSIQIISTISTDGRPQAVGATLKDQSGNMIWNTRDVTNPDQIDLKGVAATITTASGNTIWTTRQPYNLRDYNIFTKRRLLDPKNTYSEIEFEIAANGTPFPIDIYPPRPEYVDSTGNIVLMRSSPNYDIVSNVPPVNGTRMINAKYNMQDTVAAPEMYRITNDNKLIFTRPLTGVVTVVCDTTELIPEQSIEIKLPNIQNYDRYKQRLHPARYAAGYDIGATGASGATGAAGTTTLTINADVITAGPNPSRGLTPPYSPGFGNVSTNTGNIAVPPQANSVVQITNVLKSENVYNTGLDKVVGLSHYAEPIVLAQPQHGFVRISRDRTAMVYTPFPNYAGLDSFSYTLLSQHGQAGMPKSVTVEVLGTPVPIPTPPPPTVTLAATKTIVTEVDAFFEWTVTTGAANLNKEFKFDLAGNTTPAQDYVFSITYANLISAGSNVFTQYNPRSFVKFTDPSYIVRVGPIINDPKAEPRETLVLKVIDRNGGAAQSTVGIDDA